MPRAGNSGQPYHAERVQPRTRPPNHLLTAHATPAHGFLAANLLCKRLPDGRPQVGLADWGVARFLDTQGVNMLHGTIACR